MQGEKALGLFFLAKSPSPSGCLSRSSPSVCRNPRGTWIQPRLCMGPGSPTTPQDSKSLLLSPAPST